jgi:hypothetical protein
MASEALARYPHTLEEDYEMLAADTPEYSNLTFNTRNIILFRSGEKEILVFLIEMADFVLNLLEMTFKDAKRKTQSLPTKLDSCRDYLQNYVIKLLADAK